MNVLWSVAVAVCWAWDACARLAAAAARATMPPRDLLRLPGLDPGPGPGAEQRGRWTGAADAYAFACAEGRARRCAWWRSAGGALAAAGWRVSWSVRVERAAEGGRGAEDGRPVLLHEYGALVGGRPRAARVLCAGPAACAATLRDAVPAAPLLAAHVSSPALAALGRAGVDVTDALAAMACAPPDARVLRVRHLLGVLATRDPRLERALAEAGPAAWLDLVGDDLSERRLAPEDSLAALFARP